MNEVFSTRQQRQDWLDLHKAIDEAPYAPPCENFPDAFFPSTDASEDIALAKALCAVCPVIRECYAYGMKWEREGVWGGTTAHQRRHLRAAARSA